jgi:hypothetical protein
MLVVIRVLFTASTVVDIKIFDDVTNVAVTECVSVFR